VGHPRHLLSGLIHCGRCGPPCTAITIRQQGPIAQSTPTCASRRPVGRDAGESGCPKGAPTGPSSAGSSASCPQLNLEKGTKEAGPHLADIEAELSRAEAAISEVSDRQYLTQDPRLPDKSFADLIARLTTRCQVLRTAQRMASATSEGSNIRSGTLEEMNGWWSLASLEHRRVALSRAIEKMVIHPSDRPQGSRFDDRRVEVRPSTLLYTFSVPGNSLPGTGNEFPGKG
jgi:hypothetical protein